MWTLVLVWNRRGRGYPEKRNAYIPLYSAGQVLAYKSSDGIFIVDIPECPSQKLFAGQR